MTENKTGNITIKEYLTQTKFAKKYGIDTHNKDKMASLSRAMKKLNGLYAKNPSGNETQIVYKNHKCHNGTSSWLVPPFFEKRVLAEYENQELIKAKKAKGAEK